MEYNVEDIDKILNFKTWSNKKKIFFLIEGNEKFTIFFFL